MGFNFFQSTNFYLPSILVPAINLYPSEISRWSKKRVEYMNKHILNYDFLLDHFQQLQDLIFYGAVTIFLTNCNLKLS